MAIQKLEIHGYRSFENVTWEPGKLNLLVGPNGSGKSNLLRLLELISNVAQGRLASTINNAGGMVPLLWNQQASSFGWKLRLDPVDKGRDPVKDAITLHMDIAQLGAGSAFVLNRDTLGNWYEYEQGKHRSPLWIYERDSRHARVYDVRSHGLVPFRAPETFEDPDPNESLLSQIAGPLNPIPTYTRRRLEEWRVYHDVEVGANSKMRVPVVTQHSTLVDSDGSNLAAVLHTLYCEDRDFRQEIDDGMRAAFGNEFAQLVFPPAASGLIQLAVEWGSSKTAHVGKQLSDGTLRFLFLLTVLASPEPAPLIAIDEPEAGLHPSMFPIVAEYAVAAAERTQVVISSHSPEFLDAFTTYQPHLTLCHWQDGRTHLFPISPEKLQPWLEKYRLGHLFTSGDLDNLAAPDVDVLDDMEERFRDLPPEGLPLPPDPASTEDAPHG